MMTCIKTKKQKFLFAFLFCLLIVGDFGLGKMGKAQAAEPPGLGQCIIRYYESVDGVDLQLPRNAPLGRMTHADCVAAVDEARKTTYKNKGGEIKWNPVGDVTNTTNQKTVVVSPETEKGTICPGMSWTSPFTSVFNCFLLIILRFLGLILAASATLFNWILDPINMNLVMDNDVIYSTWAMVRDTLNIAFILVLLFSAFSTVFQVDKYSYKKLLLTLVLMALLVNFSYPIARFIIDFSNSLMYYLLGTLGLGNFNSVFANIAEDSQLGKIIYQSASASTVYLLASVIFIWIFTITILIIAGLFVIRTVALALLIIFSSLAFVGSIIPFMSKYSSQWWDNLFKYAFFGPVMIFMLMVATKMMNSISDFGGLDSMQKIAGQQSSDPGIVAAMSFFIIPIIILWGGIMFAQSMSLMGAGAVIGRGTKFMKWAPTALAKSTGVPGGFKKAKDYYGKKGAPGFLGKIPGLRGSEKTESSEAWVASKLGVKGAKTQDMKKRAEEYKKNNEDEGMLISRAKAGDAAAAYRLAEDKRMDQDTYNEFVSKNKDSSLKGDIDAKVKQNRADIVATNKATDINSKEYKDTVKAHSTWTPKQIQDHVATQELGKLTAEKLADQDWTSVDAKVTDPDDRARINQAMILAIGGLTGPAKAELSKRISAANKVAIANISGIVLF